MHVLIAYICTLGILVNFVTITVLQELEWHEQSWSKSISKTSGYRNIGIEFSQDQQWDNIQPHIAKILSLGPLFNYLYTRGKYTKDWVITTLAVCHASTLVKTLVAFSLIHTCTLNSSMCKQQVKFTCTQHSF